MQCSNCAKKLQCLNVATTKNVTNVHFILVQNVHDFSHFLENPPPLLSAFLSTWLNPSLQTSTIRIYLGSGMWSTDTFWSPPDRSGTPLLSELCRKAIGPRGQRFSTPGSKCVRRKRWRRSSAATGPITNWEVKKKGRKENESTAHRQ